MTSRPSILARASRHILAARAIRAVLAGTFLACLLAACGLACRVLISSGTLATIAAVPLLLTAAFLFSPTGRKLALAEKIVCLACAAGFALLAILQLLDSHLSLLSAWPAAMLLASLFSQPSRANVARRIDDGLHLKDLVSTAAQIATEPGHERNPLSLSGRPRAADGPAAPAAANEYREYVLGRAKEVGRLKLAPLGIWRGVPRLGLLTAIAAAVLVIVLFLAKAGPAEDYPAVAAALEQAVLDASDRPEAQKEIQRLADLLSHLEPAPADGPQQKQSLEDLTRAIRAAIESPDIDSATRQKLRDVLAKLQQKRVVAQGGVNPAPPSPDPDQRAKPLTPAPAFVAVTDAETAAASRPAAERSGNAAAVNPADLAQTPTSLPADYDQQFRAAQQQAAKMLREGSIPQEYRELVRAYFQVK